MGDWPDWVVFSAYAISIMGAVEKELRLTCPTFFNTLLTEFHIRYGYEILSREY